jgi:hypothetical protein
MKYYEFAHVDAITNGCQNTKVQNHVAKENINLYRNTWRIKTFDLISSITQISDQNTHTKYDLNRNQKQSFIIILDLLLAHQLKLLFVT